MLDVYLQLLVRRGAVIVGGIYASRRMTRINTSPAVRSQRLLLLASQGRTLGPPMQRTASSCRLRETGVRSERSP